MFKFILKHDKEGEYNVVHSPKTWSEFAFTFTRSEKYGSVSKMFIPDLIFKDEDKDYILNIYKKYGYAEDIELIIYKSNNTTFEYDLIYTGVIQYKSIQWGRHECIFDVTEAGFEARFFNKVDNIIDYERLTDYYGGTISKEYSPKSLIELTQFTGAVNIECIKIYDLFRKMIHVMTGKEQAFKSLFFDYNSQNELLNKGKGVLLTNGKYITSRNENNEFSISFTDLFDNLKHIYGLGMAIETRNGIDKWVRVDSIDKFYNCEIVTILENIKELEYSINEKLLFANYKVGYTGTVESENKSNYEYNTNCNYNLPINSNTGTLDLTSTFRADGTAIKTAIDEVVEAGKEGKYDNDIFILNGIKEGSKYVTSQTQNMELVSGVGGDNPIYMNVEISPVSILANNATMVTIPVIDKTGKLLFSKDSQKSKLKVKESGAIFALENCVDLDLAILGVSYLSPYKVNFNCVLTDEQMERIFLKPNGLYQFYDYIYDKFNYGWINEISTKIVDKTTNIELQLANSTIYSKLNVFVTNEGRLMQFHNGNNIRFHK